MGRPLLTAATVAVAMTLVLAVLAFAGIRASAVRPPDHDNGHHDAAPSAPAGSDVRSGERP